jgi:uncharacterized membrane protein
VDVKLAGKAIAVQTLAVVALSLILIALPLPEDFFRDFGFVAGPTAWALCAVVTAKVLRLPVLTVLAAALVAGLVGTLFSLVGGHWPGIAGGLIAFGAICGWLGRGDRIRTGVIRRERPAS